MNSMLAASLFDSPWLVAVIIIAGALINWLSQRRQAKADAEEEVEAPPTRPARPKFDPEEVLRRLLGGEAVKPQPAPPPLPRNLQPRPPDDEDWFEHEDAPPARTWVEKARQEARETRPPVPPPLPPPVRPAAPRITSRQPTPPVVRSVMTRPKTIPRSQPATASSHERRSRAGQRHGWNWRDRRSAQRAYVASLVFGPPKGLES